MRTLQFLLVMFTINNGFSQEKFDSSKVSKEILRCAKSIEAITLNPNFDYIDSSRKLYSNEIWMKMPFATNSELFELTNYPNKYVRTHAFDLLVEFRDHIDTALIILKKNLGDTLQFIEELEGDILYRRNVFGRMIKTATEWWNLQKVKNPDFLSKEQQALFDELRRQTPEKGV